MSIITPGSTLGFFGGTTSYQIERSLRFNSADSAYLSRTPASAGNRKTWTWSGWVKRSALGALQTLMSAGSGLYFDVLTFDGSDKLYVSLANAGSTNEQASLVTAAVFRDPSAWMHIVFAVDTTQATPSDRLKLWVNGTQITVFSTSSYPSLNADCTHFNTATAQSIGRSITTGWYLSAYLGECHFIDGQALTPSSFGETDSNGIWQPKRYAGTYGTNGFQLKFADNSATTATTLGKDTSGNGNNWTPNNLSVTAGTGNDSLVDTPTSYGTDTGAGGEVRGNYCTLNPLVTGSLTTVSDGNLQMTISGWNSMFGTIAYPSSGKWYYEITLSGVSSGEAMVGIFSTTGALFTAANTYYGNVAGSYAWYNAGQKWSGGVSSAYGATWGSADVIGVAFDVDTGTLTFYKNGVSQGSAYTGITGQYFPAVSRGNQAGQILICNFGQRQWAYAAPAGFKALCTQNLPAPTITKPSTVMDVALWTGNGSARSITGLGFNPDLVWIKGRSGATDHALYDSVRGVTIDLVSNSTAAETTQTQGLTAFNSDGFSLGTLAKVNTNAATYAGWTWDAGSSTVTNTAGTISSQVRANASAGFSVVSYDLQATGSKTVGHGLGVAPSLIIAIPRSVVHNTFVYHSSVGATAFLYLNTTDASSTNSTVWDNTSPTSSVFTLGSGWTSGTYGTAQIAYCFAPVAGYSAFGSYTGNGSADGPFVYTGFRPRWVLIKSSSSGNNTNWNIFDTSRSVYNLSTEVLSPNLASAEFTTVDTQLDILSNGFKLRSTTFASGCNQSGVTYVWAAFAEAPFALARAR